MYNVELAETVDVFFQEDVVLCEDKRFSKRKLSRIWQLVKTRKIDFLIYDTETTGLNIFSGKSNFFNKDTEKIEEVKGVKIFMHQFGFIEPNNDKLYCVWIDSEDEKGIKICKKILKQSWLTIIGHNLKYDYQVCFKDGIDIKCKAWDTMAATRLIHNRLIAHDLKSLGRMFSGKQDSTEVDKWEKDVKDWLKKAQSKYTREQNKYYKEFKGRPPGRLELVKIKDHINYSFVPNDIMVKYALKDIWFTYLVWVLNKDEIENNYAHTFKLEMSVIKYLMYMERRGMYIDRKRCMIGYNRLQTKTKKIQEKIDLKSRNIGWYGFNPNSHVQMKKYLVEYLKIPERLMKNKKGKLSSEKKILEALVEKHGYQKSMLGDIMSLRACMKIKNTYFENIIFRSMHTSVLNPNIKPSETKTGRAASANPSLQNIPRPDSVTMKNIPTVRSVFINRIGYKNYYFDYSQIEMVVFALFCQDKSLLKAVNAGEDLHTATARLMFGSNKFNSNPKKYRQMAKAINFGIVFGMGIESLSVNLGVTLKEARKLMEKYYDRFPGINNLQIKCKKLLFSQGYVEDMFGRRYHVEKDRAYVSVNAITQGAAANILKLAMIQVFNLIEYLNLGDKVNVLMTIHDELKIEIHESVSWLIPYYIKFTMEAISPIIQYKIFPTVDIEYTNSNWEQKENYKIRELRYKRAFRKFVQFRSRIIEPYNHEKVNWFIKKVS